MSRCPCAALHPAAGSTPSRRSCGRRTTCVAGDWLLLERARVLGSRRGDGTAAGCRARGTGLELSAGRSLAAIGGDSRAPSSATTIACAFEGDCRPLSGVDHGARPGDAWPPAPDANARLTDEPPSGTGLVQSCQRAACGSGSRHQLSDRPSARRTSGPPHEPRRQRPVVMTPSAMPSTAMPTMATAASSTQPERPEPAHARSAAECRERRSHGIPWNARPGSALDELGGDAGAFGERPAPVRRPARSARSPARRHACSRRPRP